MGQMSHDPGRYMGAEIAEAPEVFARAVSQDWRARTRAVGLDGLRAIYTIARGSSDAVANILSYEMMPRLRIPVTSLPPSAFSIYGGVGMAQAAALVISQSGASDDLVTSARGARQQGRVLAITNQPGSPVEAEADLCLAVEAGAERAVPATKTVIGSIGAGMALLAALDPEYGPHCDTAAASFRAVGRAPHPGTAALSDALARAQHIYVIGRGAGYGAAQEVALKLKECCALHAEAYSASEVLHGPLQLMTKPLLVLILDTGEAAVQPSLDIAEERLGSTGGEVHRVRPADLGIIDACPAAAAALLLQMIYPVVLATALALGHDPDAPETLSKVTRTT